MIRQPFYKNTYTRIRKRQGNMNSYEDFLKKRKEIGSGMAAKVYSYNGFAYKCFREDYPKEWIDYEYNIQQEIMKSNLLIPCYYKSEFPNSIKMDLVKGISMYDRMPEVGKEVVLEEMMTWFEKIHQVKGLNLPPVVNDMHDTLKAAPVTDEEKELAIKCLSSVESEINEPDVLCHMDYHFLNVMYEENGIHIIDWTNAKSGKAIWDYARTYVIFYEYAAGMKTKYLKEVLRRADYPKESFMKAVYVSAVLRLTEHDTKRTRQLVSNALIM